MNFGRIAIVNRGEPAMRLVHAAREYGIEHGVDLTTIALHTDTDRGAMFVRRADEAYDLGPATFVDPNGHRQVSYLDLERLERALVETRADAAWVGWGFVAERAEFVDLCDRLGVTFIGPSADVMRRLGDKITSKQIAEAAGVPVAAWSGGPVETEAEARKHAERIGFPLLVKATAGGGGRGIRRVSSPDELGGALASARAEARGAFGNDTVFLESLVGAARHIEVQIIGDDAGTVWAAGVRDCSVQRRNQKLIEEAPSPVLSLDEDRFVRESAVRLGEAAGYRNAGTVEFLYEPESGQFSFMEVNARLQVEHPITEVTTGLDLVKLQLHVADGGRLQGTAPPTTGYAIEARVNAEDPEQGFQPSPGRIELLRLPSGPGIRVDTGVFDGDEIAPEFDSMIAKIIAHGTNRSEAIARLRHALEQTEVVVRGGASNKAFLHDLLTQPAYVAGEVDVAWVDGLTGDEAIVAGHAEPAVLAAAIDAYRELLAVDIAAFRASALRGRPAVGPGTSQMVELRHRGQTHRLDVASLGGADYRVTVDGHAIEVQRETLSAADSILTVGGGRHRVVSAVHGVTHFVEVDGQPHRILHDEGGVVRAPAPAVVVSIGVAEGDEVEAGTRLAVLEAMKTETMIVAEFPGVVREVAVRNNQQVPAGTKLLVIEPSATSTVEHAETPALSFGALADDADARHDRCSHWLDTVRRMLLGYDVPSESVAAAARAGTDPCDDAAAPDDLLAQEEQILAIFADVLALFEREADVDDDPLLRHGTEGYFFDYLRRVERRAEDLPASFLERLERALAHYGIDTLDPGPALDEALFRIVRSHQRMAANIGVVVLALERRLEHRAAPEDDRRALLERVARASRADHPAVYDMVREVIHREYDAPFKATRRRNVLAEVEQHLTALAEGPAPDARAEHVDALVECPLPLKTTLSRRFAASSVELRAALLEVMTRRYYRIRNLADLATQTVDGFCVTTGEYDHDDTRVHVVATHADRAELGRCVEALVPVLQDHDPDEEVVLDIYLLSADAEPTDTTDVTEVLGATIGSLQLRRIVVAISDRSSAVGMGSVRHHTLRPDGATGYRVENLSSDLHPMMAKRLELWRLDEFEVERIPTAEDIYLFHGTARANARDERLFAIAEVRDLTPVRSSDGTLLRFPELENVVREVAAAIRREQTHRPTHRRLLSNRIVLYVWPTTDLPGEDLALLLDGLEPELADLGLQKLQVMARVRLPAGQVIPRVLELADPAGGDPRVRFRGPFTAPIKPLDAHEQNVVRLRQRGLTDPYELLGVLAPRSTQSHRQIPRGEFQEYDLVGDRLAPIDREPGLNTANVVVGVVSNQTEKYPEGMRRVVIVGDPSRGMGNVAEGECRRIMAALDLGEELDVPVEWFAVSAGARIAMDSGTENMDWIAWVLRRIIEFTQDGRELNIVVTGINVGAQPYWNAEATMLMHTRGVLIMTPESAMVLTGKDALDFSGGVSAEDNFGIGGYERVMGPNGQAQYLAHDLVDACRHLLDHYDYSYVAPGERFPRTAPTTDPVDRDIRRSPHGGEFPTIAELFSEETNPGRKKPFEMRQVMAAVVDQDHPTMERWFGMADAEIPIVWNAYLGGHSVSLLGFEAKNLPRTGMVPADGPERWTSSTLFPKGSKKVARAINATSGNRPLVVLAALSGFDGSPESMRTWQLEFGAEIGRAIVNFDGPIVFCVVSRYHGGAFVVFSAALNDRIEAAALEGSHASVIGGAPAAAVVFARDVRTRTDADPRVQKLREAVAAAVPAERGRLAAELAAVREQVHSEVMGEVAREFDTIHDVHRAQRTGSVHHIIEPSRLRPYLVEAVERGIAREQSGA